MYIATISCYCMKNDTIMTHVTFIKSVPSRSRFAFIPSPLQDTQKHCNAM